METSLSCLESWFIFFFSPKPNQISLQAVSGAVSSGFLLSAHPVGCQGALTCDSALIYAVPWRLWGNLGFPGVELPSKRIIAGLELQ